MNTGFWHLSLIRIPGVLVVDFRRVDYGKNLTI